MLDATLSHRPPITRLQPLNTHNGVDTGSSSAEVSWTSLLEPRPGEDTVLQAFVNLVSRIIITDSDETFCIQNKTGGGYILARTGAGAGKGNDEENYIFVPRDENEGDISTDFSIGHGKSLQLHVTDVRLQLIAQASIIPQAALNALGKMLEDIIIDLEKGDIGSSVQWTYPSVLNHPPRNRPVPLWPGQDQATTEPALLHRWFEQRVNDHPHRVALDFLTDLETGTRTQHTYQQVSNAATTLAVELYRARSKSNATVKTVAVLMGPCPELYVSYIAALKARLAFCPIPVEAPNERKHTLLGDLDPVAILVERADEFKEIGLGTLSVTRFLEACDIESLQSLSSSHISASEADAAYILHTSGTTGRPKGVVVSHLSAACTVSALSSHFGLYPPETDIPASHRPVRWLQGAASTFDISLFEIFWTLSTGSTLCCAPRHLIMQNVAKVITTLQADITNVTPSFANLIDPSSIRGIIVGGETLNARLLQDFACHNPLGNDTVTLTPQGIYNGYGPTEAAMYAVAQAHVPKAQRGSVIGTPLSTCGVLIVDVASEALNPVPMGAQGELVLTGPQISRTGYLNRPEETFKAFSDDAKWNRVYRTGDRARIVWDELGEPLIEFLGRISDSQVKLSGRRVELGEIENVLASKTKSVQQVLACVWKPQDDFSGSEQVVSLVVVDPKSTLDFAEVRSHCLEAARRHLPRYMVPMHILQAQKLPQTTSGKVDRKAAAAYVRTALLHQSSERDAWGPQQQENLEDAEDAALEVELTRMLADIICENSDFGSSLTAATSLADAGVDSLRAMRLLRDIRNRWPDSKNMQPPLSSLLDPKASIRSVFFALPSSKNVVASASTIVPRAKAQRQIADFASRQKPAMINALGSIDKADIEMVLPATSTQSQLAMSFAMDHRNYVSHTVVPLKEGVSPDGLEKAVNAVLGRQAIYRCAVVSCNDRLSPFSLVVLKQDAWYKWTSKSPRVVIRRQGTTIGEARAWVDMAHQSLDFASHKLYCVQIVVQPGTESDSGSGLLVISVAHCLCDGASLETLLQDIAREYAALDPRPRLGIEDAVINWVCNLDTETDRKWQEALQGWEVERFHALSGNNASSSVIPGVAVDYEHQMVQLTSSLQWQTLQARSRAFGASPLSILQASWSLLLQIFSEANTGDVVFGSVISGQHEAAHAPTFSVVPCRVALPDRQTVRELLAQLVESSKFAQRYSNMSFGIFETLPYNTALALQAYSPVEADYCAQTPRDAAAPWVWTEMRNPAIRYDLVIFAEVFPFPADPCCEGGTMSFKLTYRDDALSHTSAHVILRQFATMTEILLASNSEDVVQSLPARLPRDLLSAEGTIPSPTDIAAEKDRQARERVELLHAQFENQAVATPSLLALSFYTALDVPPVELTYAELDGMANELADILREKDVDIIPICMQRSVELYVSILAILKAGSAWSPIDETAPLQRRISLISRTKGKVLLSNTASFHLVEPCLHHDSLAGVCVILVDQYLNNKTSTRAEPRPSIQEAPCGSAIQGQNLAYLLWTSGTTGEPKGVMIQHYAAANAMRDLQFQVGRDDTLGQVRTLQLSSYSFDVFVQDLFFTWGIAGSVISGTRELILGSFTKFVNTACPTHAHITPSFGASIDVEEIRGSTLQYVTFIGEKLTENVAEAWTAPGIATKVYNTYGPAENAVVSTMRQCFGKSRDRAKAGNVGFPLKSCTAYVVRQVESGSNATPKKQWELVPRYGVGELALGGAQVGKGYLNDEVMSRKAFIYGGRDIEERIYLTGDIVRLNDHGFEFLGRNDDLVKITGIRIELSEISAACATVKDVEPGVEHIETLYLPRPGGIGGDPNHKVLVTFVSTKKRIINIVMIRKLVFQKAKEALPAYMVPGHVVVLEHTMPRTASNKVDRKALQKIYNNADLDVAAGREATSSSSLDGAKWPEDQHPVINAIAKNFNVPVEPLSPDDSLAGLGFSSLQVTKLAWDLRRQLEFNVGVLDLMRCLTLGELVKVVIDSSKKTTQPLEDSNIDPALKASWVALMKDKLTENLHGPLRPPNTSYILPATPVQESLLAETMVETGAYWSHRIFDLSHLDQIDASRLEAAWKATAARLDILRTVFVPLSQLSVRTGCAENLNNTTQWARQQGVHAIILQFVLQDAAVNWESISEADEEALVSIAKAIQAKLRPLGTNSSSLPWAVTFSKGNNKMMLSMHHALHDGTSSDMMLAIVASMYRNPQQALDVCNATVQMARGMELGLLPSSLQREEALSAWTKRLHGLVKTSGALNGPFPDLTGSRQKQMDTILSVHKIIPKLLLERRTGTPDLPRLVQSAFGCVLAATLELKTVILGQTVSQRLLHPDLARLVGPAMATLPVVVRAHASSAEQLWSEMANDTSTLSHSAHKLHPVDIKKMVNEGSEHSHAPFPALFVYHPAVTVHDAYVDAGREMFREIGHALSLNVEHPMALNVFEADNTIVLTGNARLISQPMLQLMLEQILDQARAMLENPKVPLDQLSNYMNRELISVSGEIATIVGTFEISRNPFDLVTKQATEHPDWIAVEEIFLGDDVDGDGDNQIVTKTLTYWELQVLVNAIASALTSHEANLQPNDVVALYLERDTKSLAAILAVFKCGYVYLPIDGDLPAARKQFLVRDGNAKLVLTTEALFGFLKLNQNSDPPAVFLPEGDNELEVIRTWPITLANDAPDDTTKTTEGGGYLLYTSGSTGRPKGVRVTNESLLHFISAMTKRLIEANADTANLGGVGKYLNVASRAFDTHLTSMFAPWHLGFRSAIGKDRNGIFASLQQVINKVKITHMGSVPSVLMQLGLHLEHVPSLRVLTFGGEKASEELFEQLSSGNPNASLMNFYGPTEATIGCLSHIVGPQSNSRNLGKPLHGLAAILLAPNDDGEQVAARKGQPGEFCIAGPQLAVGYLDRPEENAKGFQYTKLLGSGSGGGGQHRIYRTGDMMRMMQDGSLEFLGRKDQQIKIRGQRFEISEVEACIKKTVADEGALDVAATVANQRLMGFLARKKTSLLKAEVEAEPELLLSPDNNKDLQALLPAVEQACRDTLPAFMVPEMMWVSKIPYLAASGKIDSKGLLKLANDFIAFQQQKPSQGVAASAAKAQPAEHGLAVSLKTAELEVVAALREILGSSDKVISSATSTSSIRSLGIDSLLGLQLVTVLKQRGFGNATLVDLMSPSCTVASIALTAGADAILTKHTLTKELKWSFKDLGSSARGLNEADVEAVFPSLPLQSSLIALSLNWLGCRSVEETSDYDMNEVPYVTQFKYRLAPGTDLAQWKAAAAYVLSSEAMLRTCFIQCEEDGQILQVVLKSPPLPFEDQEDAATIVAQMSSRPPVRIHIQQDVGTATTTVLLTMHHALYDGAAVATLRKKIEQAYNSNDNPVAAYNRSLGILQRLANHCHLTGEQLHLVKGPWLAKLSGILPCRVGADSHAHNKDTNIVHVRKHIAHTWIEMQSKLPQEDGRPVSMSSVFQLATALCLASLTKQPSIVYGFTMSLRPLLSHIVEGVDEFVGPCLNTVVHAISIKDNTETLPRLAERIHRGHTDACLGSMPLVTADQIQRWAGLEEKLFDSLLTINVLSADDVSTNARSAPGQMWPLPGKSQGDLALAIDVDVHADGKIVLQLASAGVLTEAQLDYVGNLFETIVASSADGTATVEQFVSMDYETVGLVPDATTKKPNPAKLEPQLLSGTSFDVILACVQYAACRLLRLDEADFMAKNFVSKSLYQLGLDSINVLPFLRLIYKSQGIKLAPNAVLRARTVQGVAALIYQKMSHCCHAPKLNVADRGHEIDEPKLAQYDKSMDNQTSFEKVLKQLAGDLLFIATPLQEGMLSASIDVENRAYHFTHTMQLSEYACGHDTANFETFFTAVEDTVRACEILRSRFIFTKNDDAPWVGVVSPTEQSDLVRWDVSKGGVIQLTIHHALYDARSIQAMWRLLNRNYARRLTGHEENQVKQQVEEYPFRPFAQLSVLAQNNAVAFWTSTIQDFVYKPIEITEESPHASASSHFTLNESELSNLQSKCREAGVSLKAAIQLSWAKVLCESVYKQGDVVFGEVITTGGEDSETVLMGPAINTIPVRVKLTSKSDAMNIYKALCQLQKLGDDARGSNGMASLRAVQRAWRSSRADGVDTSCGLFQSLFVFDGIIPSERGSESPTNDLIVPVQAQAHDDDDDIDVGQKSHAYDEYPIIVSFRIKDRTLHGALRAKVGESKVIKLGKQLGTALRYLAAEKLHSPVLDPAHVQPAYSQNAKRSPVAKNAKNAISKGPELAGSTEKADAIAKIVKEVVGNRMIGTEIGYHIKLVNIGLDSISAIRFSKLLKKKMGIHASVFEIIRGASIYDIVKKSLMLVSAEKHGAAQSNGGKPLVQVQRRKGLIASKLNLAEDRIKSISSVLPGQRETIRQWLHNGKRFFEAPWAYRILDGSISTDKVAGYWEALCQMHDVLRTTFIYTDDPPQLVQVTLDEKISASSRLATVSDSTMTVRELMQKQVREGITKPSNFTEPPARLTFFEASDGKAIILSLHHALYDAWSIKLIQKDLARLFAAESFAAESVQSYPPVQLAVQEISNFRQPEAEQRYWKQYLAGAQDTIIQPGRVSANRNHGPLGSYFRTAFADILPQTVADALNCNSSSSTNSKAHTSAVIIIAYAHALGRVTGCSHPTFGLNYSSRSLSSIDGQRTLDLTGMSIPTMTVIPVSVDLKTKLKLQLLEATYEHLAQLTRFAQADDLSTISPRFNSYINILFSDEDAESQLDSVEKGQALQRHKLGEPIVSEYFTHTASSSIVSTVDGIDTSHLHDQQFYFNVLVRKNGNIYITVSGDEDLLCDDQDLVTKFIEHFGAELFNLIVERK